MYTAVRMVKMKACKMATKASKPVMAMSMAKGRTATGFRKTMLEPSRAAASAPRR